MALSDLVKSGVDLGNRNAVESAIESDEALAASAETREHETPEPVNPDPGDETPPAEGETPATPAEGEPAELEAPVPTGEAAQPDAKDTEIADLKRQLAEANTKAAGNAAAQAKSQAAQERATILAEMVEELGESHPIVKETKRRHAAEDAAEQREVTTSEAATSAQEAAAHATHIVNTPFLKSLYDSNDEIKLAAAGLISEKIMADPKLAGTKAAEPFTAEHYREVEARMLVEYPQAKAQFYKTGKPAKTDTGKVVSLSQVRGGSSPAAGSGGKGQSSRDDVFSKVLSSDPNVSLDQLLSNMG